LRPMGAEVSALSMVAGEGHATTSIPTGKASEFNDLIATGERI
jgi:hypothetical protein